MPKMPSNPSPVPANQNERIEPLLGSTENQIQEYPLSYTYLAIILSSLFGIETIGDIVNFWSKNRQALKEIYRDFPSFDISETAVRRLLMMTYSFSPDFIFEDLLRPISDQCFRGSILKEDDYPQLTGYDDPDYDLQIFECFFFVTEHGIAIAQKQSKKEQVDQNSDFSFNDEVFPDLSPLNITGTVVSCDTDGLTPGIAEFLISRKADYFLAIGHEHQTFLQELQFTFENQFSTRKISTETIDIQKDRAITKRISVLPATLLKKETLKAWNGLDSGSLIKATFEAKEQPDQVHTEDYFYISSLCPNSQIAEQASRAIWHYRKLPHTYQALLDIDFFPDITPVRNAFFIESMEELRKPKRFLSLLNTKIAKSLNEFKKGSKKVKIKNLLENIINDLTWSYGEKHEEEAMEEDREENPWEY